MELENIVANTVYLKAREGMSNGVLTKVTCLQSTATAPTHSLTDSVSLSLSQPQLRLSHSLSAVSSGLRLSQ